MEQRWCARSAQRPPSPNQGALGVTEYSPSVKTEYASEERGIDGGKKVKGHKRHILVEALGNLLPVSVHAANCSDTLAAGSVLARAAEKPRASGRFLAMPALVGRS